MTTRPPQPSGRSLIGRGSVLVAVTVLGVVLPGSSSALAAPGDGYLRLAHLSPDTPAVDVYLYAAGRTTPRLVLKHVGYGDLSPYQRLSGGAYTVAMRPADAAASSPPVLSARVRVRAREAYTVAGLGPYKGITLRVLDDALAVPPGRSALRVIEASLKRPTVTVTADDRPLADGLRFPTVTGYRPMRAGTTTVRVASASGAPLTARLSLRPGSIHTLVVLDGPSAPRLLDLRDATAPRRTPRGSVETGLGGLAGLAGPVAPPPWATSARLLPLPDGPPGEAPAPAAPPTGVPPTDGPPTETSAPAAPPTGIPSSGIPSPGVLPPAAPRAGTPPTAVRPAAGEPPAALSPAAPPNGSRSGAYAEPVMLRIPALGVRTILERLPTDRDGRLQPPRDPARAGWFGDGIRPGAPGPAVIAGHVDSRTGPAVFTGLGSLRPGDRIQVTDAKGRVVAFTVDRVRSYPKTEFPTKDVYGATPDPQLRLITCGGAFDPASGHYRRDVVVYASLAP
ncbi:class F sortase [Actinoallomurus sp. NPDC050550]|uniref:class F sortase n=1 Tax=Actinoallomurus sp. NPDC050550 TaxID=3154937 RepID=UPI0033D88AA0